MNGVVIFGNLGRVAKIVINNMYFFCEAKIEHHIFWHNGDFEMTFEEFKIDFLRFLSNSTVNLGRRNTKTRQTFLDEASTRFDIFMNQTKTKASEPMDDRILRIKPKNRRKALDIGKGVHAMTSTESMRADEQLNRSPYGTKQGKQKK